MRKTEINARQHNFSCFHFGSDIAEHKQLLSELSSAAKCQWNLRQSSGIQRTRHHRPTQRSEDLRQFFQLQLNQTIPVDCVCIVQIGCLGQKPDQPLFPAAWDGLNKQLVHLFSQRIWTQRKEVNSLFEFSISVAHLLTGHSNRWVLQDVRRGSSDWILIFTSNYDKISPSLEICCVRVLCRVWFVTTCRVYVPRAN